MGPAARATGMRGDIRSIQHLRGLAVLGVVLFHASRKAGMDFSVGAAGIDVFFIISGFIMWTVCSRRTTGVGDFLMRRVGRIAPLYWLATLLVVAAHALRPELSPGLRPTPAHVIPSLLFLPHADSAGATAPVLAAGWTLVYAVFFYAMFALILLLPRGRRSVTLTAALGALCFLGLVLPRGRWAVVDAYTDPLLLEFAVGIWLAKAAAAGRLGRTWQALAGIAVGVAFLAGVAAIGVKADGWTRLLCWGLPALLIVWGALSLEGCGQVPAIAPLKGLGDASYSLYLTHGLALSLAFRLFAGRDLPALLEIALAVVLAVVCGVLCHWLVERPLLAAFHGPRGRQAALRARTGWAFLRPKVQP